MDSLPQSGSCVVCVHGSENIPYVSLILQQLVLSLFPGVGLLDMAFEQEGFCVVRGPDVLWGGDIRRFHPAGGKFDGVIGGPPCQAFSPLAHMVRHNGHEPKFGNLIPEYERVVREAGPAWFIMENVPQAPAPLVKGYDVYSYMLNNRQCVDEDGKPAKQNRTRRFSWGWKGSNRPQLLIDTVTLFNQEIEYAACGGTHGIGGIGREEIARAHRKKTGRNVTLNDCVGFNIKSKDAFKQLCALQGLPASYDLEPFTVSAKCKAIGNGVPLPMGRAIAKAVLEATT